MSEEIIETVVLSEIKYPVSQESLTTLLDEYKDIPNIDPDADDETVAEQYQFVLKGHKAFVKARNGIEKTRKTLKAPALEYGKTVDGIAKEFQTMIKSTEEKLFIQRKIVEDNEARKQREAEEREEQRVNAIQKFLKEYEQFPLTFLNVSSEHLASFLETELKAPTEIVFEEYLEEANAKYQVCVTTLNSMLENKKLVENAQKLQAEAEEKARLEKEESDRKLQAERDEFARQQAEFQQQKENFERQQREQQEILDRQEAEREADELQAKQEAERVEAERLAELQRQQAEEEAEQNKEKHIAETLEAIDKYLDYGLLLNKIIAGEIPNLKWVG